MSKTMWTLVLIMDIFFAGLSAINGDVAATVLDCFLGYIAFQFLREAGGADHERS